MRRTILKSLLASVLAGAFLAAPSFASQDGNPPVDLNTASVEELTTLPGVGETVAERIVDYREANGPFQKKEELMNVRGIGEKTFLKLEPLIRVSPAASEKK